MHFACPGLVPMLRCEATVVASSRLLAQVASSSFSQERLANGFESWRRPNVYSTTGWLGACWQNARYSGTDLPALLSPVQEHTLWQRIIKDETPGLFDFESTAVLASRASRLIAEWHIPLESEAWNQHEDGQQFRKWLATFRRICKEEGWVSYSELWHLIPKWISSGCCGDTPILFAGFPYITPALSRLREALGSAARMLDSESRVPASSIPARRCSDLNEEIEAAARWARAAFEADPANSIGIFVPDLANNRSLVERTFDRICYPGDAVSRLMRDRLRDSESVFHLHAAAPLRNHPIVAGALRLFHLATFPNSDRGSRRDIALALGRGGR